MLDVRCSCGTQLSLPAEWAGKQGKCPACGAVLTIPPLATVALGKTTPVPPPERSAWANAGQASPAPKLVPRAKPASPAPTFIEAQRAPVRIPKDSAPPDPAPSNPLPRRSLRELLDELPPAANPLRWSLAVQVAAVGGSLALLVVAMLGVISIFSKIQGRAETGPSPSLAAQATKTPAPIIEEEETLRTPVQPNSSPLIAAGPPSPAPEVAPRQIVAVSRQPLSSAEEPAPTRGGVPGKLSGLSRDYDDLHCQRIAAQHGLRIPAAATIVEVDGERLPIVNVSRLSESASPLVLLPRGTHAVRFRASDSPVAVEVGGDLADQYEIMRRYFGLPNSPREHELFSRSAKALDVHRQPFLLNFMGAADAAAGRTEAAERKFRRALRVNPLFAPAHLNLAASLAARGATSQAAEELELADACNIGNACGAAAGISALRKQLKQPAPAPGELELTLPSYVYDEELSEEDLRMTALVIGMAKYAVKEEERGKLLNNLGAHFADLGRTELALDHFRGALAVLRTAGPERYQLARQVLGHMSEACRKAGFTEADEYRRMQGLVGP